MALEDKSRFVPTPKSGPAGEFGVFVRIKERLDRLAGNISNGSEGCLRPGADRWPHPKLPVRDDLCGARGRPSSAEISALYAGSMEEKHRYGGAAERHRAHQADRAHEHHQSPRPGRAMRPPPSRPAGERRGQGQLSLTN